LETQYRIKSQPADMVCRLQNHLTMWHFNTRNQQWKGCFRDFAFLWIWLCDQQSVYIGWEDFWPWISFRT